MSELTSGEKEHIRLTEVYRSEVQLGMKSEKKGLKEAVGYPVLVVLATAVVSGILVPLLLRAHDDRIRWLDLKARMVEDIVAQSTGAQTALLRYHEQLCDYWAALVRLRHRRARVMLRGIKDGDDDVKAQLQAIRAGHDREDSIRIEADKQMAEAKQRFQQATSRLESLLEFHFGSAVESKGYIRLSRKTFSQVESDLNEKKQDTLSAAYSRARDSLEGCKTEADCDKFRDQANETVESVRKAGPDFKVWVEGAAKVEKEILRVGD